MVFSREKNLNKENEVLNKSITKMKANTIETVIEEARPSGSISSQLLAAPITLDGSSDCSLGYRLKIMLLIILEISPLNSPLNPVLYATIPKKDETIKYKKTAKDMYS